MADTPKHPDLIYDVGMHRGEDTRYYLKKGFRVVAFEADPALTAECSQTFSTAISNGSLTIVPGAIIGSEAWDKGQRSVRFFKNIGNSAWGTISTEWASRNEMLGTRNQEIEVAAVDFSGCLQRYGIPYYMKIDIEGTDCACLRALLAFSARPDYVSIESEKVDFKNLGAELDLLEQLGYGHFQAVEQSAVARQIEPNPPREGCLTDHRFQPGSSGLFGRDLPEHWKDRRELIEQYRRIFIAYRLFGDRSPLRQYRLGRLALRALSRIAGHAIPGWYDTHARLASSHVHLTSPSS